MHIHVNVETVRFENADKQGILLRYAVIAVVPT